MLDWFLDALSKAEAELLLLRTAFEWSQGPAELYALPPTALKERMEAVLGSVDLSAFATTNQ